MAEFKWVRTYNITIPDKDLDKIREEGWPEGSLLDCISRMMDMGDYDPAVLCRYKQSSVPMGIEAGTLEWFPDDDVFPEVEERIYTVYDWNCDEEAGTTVT